MSDRKWFQMFKKVLSCTILIHPELFFEDGSSASDLNQDELRFERSLINVNQEWVYLSNSNNAQQATSSTKVVNNNS